MRRHRQEINPVEVERALAKPQHAGDRVDERALAGAVRADDGDELAGIYGDRNADDRRRSAIADGERGRFK